MGQRMFSTTLGHAVALFGRKRKCNLAQLLGLLDSAMARNHREAPGEFLVLGP